MERLAVTIGILAGLVQLAGYVLYNRTARKPSAMSWGIWGIGSFLTYFLYGELVQDWVKEFLPLLCMLAALTTFTLCLRRKLLDRPDRTDWFILVLDVAVIAYWLTYRETKWANLFLQIDVAISFIPQLRSVWKSPSSEDSKPWLVWSVAYLLLLTTVVMRWESWWELLYPVNYFILHLGVWALARRRTVK